MLKNDADKDSMLVCKQIKHLVWAGTRSHILHRNYGFSENTGSLISTLKTKVPGLEITWSIFQLFIYNCKRV